MPTFKEEVSSGGKGNGTAVGRQGQRPEEPAAFEWERPMRREPQGRRRIYGMKCRFRLPLRGGLFVIR